MLFPRARIALAALVLVSGLFAFGAAVIVRRTDVSAAQTFTVNSPGDYATDQVPNYCITHDSGLGIYCTLRLAIEAANLTPGHDTINFDQAVFANDREITIDRELPLIDASQGVTVDGGTAEIEISGFSVPLDHGLVFYTEQGVPLKDVSVKYFHAGYTKYDGIQVCGGVNYQTVACEGTVNNVTLDHVSTFGTRSSGIRILGSSISDVHLTDVVLIHTREGPGILIQSSPGSISNVSLAGDVVNDPSDPPDSDGVQIKSGAYPDYAPINGLSITDFTESDSGQNGISVAGSDVQNVNVDGLDVSNNDFTGFRIDWTETLQHVLVTRSKFGAGASGIVLTGPSSGTAETGDIVIDNNVLSGNIFVFAPVLNDTTIENNTINAGDNIGIALSGTTGSGNIIRNSIVTGHTMGIELYGKVQTTITRNSIHDNSGLGIDLHVAGDPSNGVTPNDAGDGDIGPNGVLNYPVFTADTAEELTGTACANCLIELFFAQPDVSGYGEGQTFIRDGMSDGAGNFTISLCQTNVDFGQVVTATATDSNGNTSEFSAWRYVSQNSSDTCVPPTTIPTPSPTPTHTGTPTPTPTHTGGPTNTAAASPTIAPGARKQGDLNCTGSVDGADAVIALRSKLGLSLPGRAAGCPGIGTGSPKFGDVNCDGKVDLKDALAIVQFWSGAAINPPQPGGCTALGEDLPT